MPEARSLPLLYSGSVKDVYGLEGKSPYVFLFSDRYSIFDWGEMPNALEGKGEALAVMGDLLFQYLGKPEAWSAWQISERFPKFWRDSLTTSRIWTQFRRSGMPHHSLGLVSASHSPLPLGARSKRLAVQALSRPPAVSSVREGKIQWDYSAYEARPEESLVPLEVVFRFGAPEGSSFLERLATIPDYAQSFGFPETPRAGDSFAYPIVEFFTKLEPTDRFLTREEAMKVAALNQDELDDLTAFTKLVALRLRDIFSPLGLELWDGKFEFSFRPSDPGRRSFQLVDSIGPDELRLIGPGGVHFSKEFLRRVYRGTPWYEALGKAKKMASERGEKDWKKICREELRQVPDPLSPPFLEAAESLYPSLAEALAKSLFQKSIYPELPTVTELCAKIRGLT
jgi:phosphoribosylaminoimidazole-succinocarboxamide synthase